MPEPSEPGIRIYPNPFNKGFYIDRYTEVERLNIYHISGVLVKSVPNPDNFIDMSACESGFYLLEVQLRNGDREYVRILKD